MALTVAPVVAIRMAMAPRLLHLLAVLLALGAVAPATAMARAEYAEVAATPITAAIVASGGERSKGAMVRARAQPRRPFVRSLARGAVSRAPLQGRRYLLLRSLLL